MDTSYIEGIKRLRENTTFIEFDEVLNNIKKANDLADLDRYLDSVDYLINIDGLKPAWAFEKALIEITSEP